MRTEEEGLALQATEGRVGLGQLSHRVFETGVVVFFDGKFDQDLGVIECLVQRRDLFDGAFMSGQCSSHFECPILVIPEAWFGCQFSQFDELLLFACDVKGTSVRRRGGSAGRSEVSGDRSVPW